MVGKLFSPSFTNGEVTSNAPQVLILSKKRYFPNPKWELLSCAHHHIILGKLICNRFRTLTPVTPATIITFHTGSYYLSLQTERKKKIAIRGGHVSS